MPPMNAKNASLSPASSALGLGDQLKEQVQSKVEDMRAEANAKVVQAGGSIQQNTRGGPFADATLSPAVQSLLGKQGGFGG